LAVVTVFQEKPSGTRFPRGYQLALWALAVLDVVVVAWMLSAGEWLDRAAPVVTLGGHHVVVLWLAVAGFLLLGAMAALTGGFLEGRRELMPFVVLSALVSVVALAGMLAGLMFALLAVFVLTLLGAAFLGKATVFLGHLGGLFRR
jgi:hypothetical protein